VSWAIAATIAAISAAIWGGWSHPRAASIFAAAAALVAAISFALAWAAGGGAIDLPLLGALGARWRLELDPLAAPLVVFVTGLAAVVLVYSRTYLAHHLPAHELPPQDEARFARLMLGFMAAMVLLLIAHDLLVLFIALELTALASYLLIGFDRRDREAQRAATTALIVTLGSSLLFLLAVLWISARAGTTQLAELRAIEGGVVDTGVAACLVLGVLAKSAQVPLHFWLPRAMVAPTPVSAYLHSAALVAAGVFVLQRLRFLLQGAPEVLGALSWIGFLSIAVGGALALTADPLKRILAYSTIAQYGYALVLIAAGGSAGLAGGPLFLIAHGGAKAALFLTAGAVQNATRTERLSELGGLFGSMRLLGIAALVAAAGLAGLPLTIGYFKDELFFAAAHREGPAPALFALAAAALTFAYSARFWHGIFGGPRRGDAPSPVSLGLSVPVAILAALVVAGGVFGGPLGQTVSAAGAWIGGEPIAVSLHYRLEASRPLAMSLAAFGLGAALIAAGGRWGRRIEELVREAGQTIGPARWAERVARAFRLTSGILFQLELREIALRVGAVLLPTALLVSLGLFSLSGGLPELAISSLDLPVAVGLAVTVLGALAVTRPLQQVPLLLLLSFASLGLTLTFVLSGAPNVALVLVLVETALTLLFLALLWQLRRGVLAAAREHQAPPRSAWPGFAGGLTLFVIAWVALEQPRAGAVATAQLDLAPAAHAKDVVTAILADFRGLDTLGEVTVLAVAILGAAAMSRGRAR
jgi:multicomponent Na+:H+ antiporter subunit A